MKIVGKIPRWLRSRVRLWATALGIHKDIDLLFIEYRKRESAAQPDGWLGDERGVQYEQAQIIFTVSPEITAQSQWADDLVQHEVWELFFQIHLRDWLETKLSIQDQNYLNKKIDKIIESLIKMQKDK